MPEKLHVLIADDEPLARQRIEDLLAKEKDVDFVAAATGGEAIARLREGVPDIVFLDVQMPDRNGLEVVKEVGAENMPVTVFVTAFSKFALEAFDVAAVDYLVKPFDDERFAEALQRARKRAVERRREMKSRFLDRVAVESRGQTRVVPVAAIDYITASGPYAELHAGGKVFAVRERMQTLEEQLDPEVFFRVHRSAIVKLKLIVTLLHRPGGDYAVRLKDGTELDLSRARRDELQERLGIK